jgi:hypothetical protein
MGKFIILAWAILAAVYCVVQVVQVLRSLGKPDQKFGDLWWALISAFVAIVLGGITFGYLDPLMRLVFSN